MPPALLPAAICAACSDSSESSSAPEQALGMDDGTDRILFARQAAEQDSLTIPSASVFRRDLIHPDPESMSLARDGDDLVLTLGDGTRAVFRRQ